MLDSSTNVLRIKIQLLAKINANGEEERELLRISKVFNGVHHYSNKTSVTQLPLITGLRELHLASQCRTKNLASNLNASGQLDLNLSQLASSAKFPDCLKMSLNMKPVLNLNNKVSALVLKVSADGTLSKTSSQNVLVQEKLSQECAEPFINSSMIKNANGNAQQDSLLTHQLSSLKSSATQLREPTEPKCFQLTGQCASERNKNKSAIAMSMSASGITELT
jgi:hypothetical protein